MVPSKGGILGYWQYSSRRQVWSTSRYGSYYCTTLPLYLGTTRSHSYPREATYPSISLGVVLQGEWVVYSRVYGCIVGIVSMVGYEMSTQMPLYHTYCTISLILVYPTNLSILYLLVIPLYPWYSRREPTLYRSSTTGGIGTSSGRYLIEGSWQWASTIAIHTPSTLQYYFHQYSDTYIYQFPL